MNFKKQRTKMVQDHLKKRDIIDQKVLSVMNKVPREKFVPEQYKSQAYADSPLPIGKNQTISQPYVVAKMIQLLELKESDVVLDIGTGSGYQAAVLAEIVQQVFTMERLTSLAEKAKAVLKKLDYKNIKVIVGDGQQGLPKEAPFNGIKSAAASSKIPQAWKEQLAIGGKIVAPVRENFGQRLIKITREDEENYHQEKLNRVAFVPLID